METKFIKDKPCFIIAELSANHNNSYELAVKTIEAIAKSGADAVKVQTYKPSSLTLDIETGFFLRREKGLWKGYTPWQLYSEAAMPYDWQPKLKKVAENLGLVFFSSPFDIEGVDFLETLNIPLYKIASFEITDIPLIQYVAEKGKPIIISTGIAELSDIELAVNTCKKTGNDDITLLKCTTEYPASVEQANLLTIPNLKETFGVNVGVSDHTLGATVPVVSVALGAKVIEKHFILDRNLGGPDSAFSMEPYEFEQMVKAVREAENSLGNIGYQVKEENKLKRRSLFISEDINAGEMFTHLNVKSIRPGNGLHPKYYSEVLGKFAKKNITKGTPLKFEHFI